ncbi:MAG: hypothetical protein JAY82_03815 [Candidatus Thiodiazotropha taylori]|nr:hypothetical protein [Candidatus Thiodiazotropha taylori]
MTDKKPINEGFTRGQIKGGTENQQTKPAVKPKSPPPAPKPKPTTNQNNQSQD